MTVHGILEYLSANRCQRARKENALRLTEYGMCLQTGTERPRFGDENGESFAVSLRGVQQGFGDDSRVAVGHDDGSVLDKVGRLYAYAVSACGTKQQRSDRNAPCAMSSAHFGEKRQNSLALFAKSCLCESNDLAEAGD